MARISSIDEFRQFSAILAQDEQAARPRIVICAGTACQASASSDIIRVAKRHILEKGLLERVGLRVTGCHGFCEMGPFVLTEPQKAFYSRVAIDDVPRIIDAVVEDRYVEELLYCDPVTGERFSSIDDIPFFKNQHREILALNQKVDPIRMYDYIAQGGYSAFATLLEARDPGWVVEQVKLSGLRGRGGAGFPTGRKWELLARQPGGKGRILVCNADEGDPGAYMDRSMLEGNPHSIMEGMLIGAIATGATEGVVYVRAEYPLAIKHLTIALRQASDHGLLGSGILGTDFSFDISIVRGAGAFVCGEETALIRSIDGRMGEPRQRPPYPVERGVEGRPTAINNVETWANVPIIFRKGAAEYAKLGTKGNAGTKIFSLVGKIKNTGLVEVPMGTTLSRIVYDIGGGQPGSAKIKAVQTGGPSGGAIPAAQFHLPVDYESLASVGSIMGSGGMIVLDDNTCMVDLAKYYMTFLKDESCGKCFSCRKGTQRMYEILDDVTRGESSVDELDLLEELAEVVKDASMCGLGQTASNPVLSTIKYFRDEYMEHIQKKRCRAFVCRQLTGAPCQSACPLGTEAWRYVAHIRRGEFEEAYRVIREANPFPSVCARVCNHPCEGRCRAGTTGGGALAIRALKRFVTDRFDPASYRPVHQRRDDADEKRVAIVGSGPAGLTAAHYLSLMGYKVTVLESDARPGGMLHLAIPSYRLPREVLEKEIHALFDENITLRCGITLGKDITLDRMLEEGFKAVFLAMGAHKSRRLGLPNEDAPGVHPSMAFLKAHNAQDRKLAKGHVGVVGGGNSAVDAARTALRQPGVKSVTLFYRRTREEMPAFQEEIEAALQEGVRMEMLVTPTEILASGGRLTGIACIRNRLGDMDRSGRRRPVPIEGSEFKATLDTLIVAISEGSDVDCVAVAGASKIETADDDKVRADPETLCTNRPGVFAGGDTVTGPNTVVNAIAAGKRAALMIDRYLSGKPLDVPVENRVPSVYIEQVLSDEAEVEAAVRVELPRIPAESRRRSFSEVEAPLSEDEAIHEASRCLRCDLEFTRPASSDVDESRSMESKVS